MKTRRAILRIAPGLAVLLSALLAGCVGYYPASYGYQPPVITAAPPTMVWLPSAGAYVALGYNYPLFYTGNSYYYSYGNRWYSGPNYRGPWRTVPGPPPPLRGFQSRYWPDYQSRANRYYRSNPNWQHFQSGGRR